MTLNKDNLKEKQVKYLIDNWWRLRSKYKNNKKAYSDFAKRFANNMHWRTVENWYYANKPAIDLNEPKMPSDGK